MTEHVRIHESAVHAVNALRVCKEQMSVSANTLIDKINAIDGTIAHFFKEHYNFDLDKYDLDLDRKVATPKEETPEETPFLNANQAESEQANGAN